MIKKKEELAKKKNKKGREKVIQKGIKEYVNGVTNVSLDAVHVRRRNGGQLDPLCRYDMGVVFLVLGGSKFEWPCVVGQKFMKD